MEGSAGLGLEQLSMRFGLLHESFLCAESGTVVSVQF